MRKFYTILNEYSWDHKLDLIDQLITAMEYIEYCETIQIIPSIESFKLFMGIVKSRGS